MDIDIPYFKLVENLEAVIFASKNRQQKQLMLKDVYEMKNENPAKNTTDFLVDIYYFIMIG